MQKKTCTILISGFLCIIPIRGLAYGVATHGYITGEAIRLYNESVPDKKIPEKYQGYLIDGSRREDDAPRWMNHFYDPVYNRGLTGVAGDWHSSKIWAESEDSQNALGYKASTGIASILTALQHRKVSELSTETNFTWQRAIRFYVRGEKEKAFFILGHVIHLIEDAGVPDHTRNDPHPGDSPYENWTSQFIAENPDNDLRSRLKSAILEESLGRHFDDLASYSNGSFYSKDTVGIQAGYDSPQPDYEVKDGDYFYGIKTDPDGREYKLFFRTKSGLLRSESLLVDRSKLKIFLEKEGGDVVIRDYWDQLSVAAVRHAAGVIDLFFREVEKAEKDPDFQREEPPTLLGQLFTVAESISFYIDRWFVEEEVNTQVTNLVTNDQEIEIFESAPKSSEEIQDTSSPTQFHVEDEVLETGESPAVSAVLGDSDSNTESDPIPTFELPPEPVSGGGAPVIVTTYAVPASSFPEDMLVENSTPPIASLPPEPVSNPDIVAADRVVLGEILFDADGSDNGKEFIELYNPTDTTVDMTGWTLEYQITDTTSSIAFTHIGSKDTDATVIPARGFFLIGLNNFNSERWPDVYPDVVRSGALPNGLSDATITIRLVDPSGEEADSLKYGADSIHSPGESIERMAVTDGACLEPRDSAEFLGNACDRGSDEDFFPRAEPLPQSSRNLPEPRNAPHIADFKVEYDMSTLLIHASWSAAEDGTGSVTSTIYTLKEASSTADLFRGTSTLSFDYRVTALDRNYLFILTASDRDGFSGSVSEEILVPSLLDAAYLYRDRRPGLENQYVVDLRYKDTPFIPRMFLPNESWYQGMMFYLNREPNISNFSLAGVDSQFPQDMEGILPVGQKGGPAAVFGLLPERCVSFGQGIGANCWYLDSEDPRTLISVAAPGGKEFSTADYFTIAYYDFSPGPGGGLRLVAHESAKRYFQDSVPPESAPQAPDIIAAQFNKFESAVNFTYDTSTDPDTTDMNLLYESNITTSTAFEETTWRNHGRAQGGTGISASYIVAGPGTYRLGVRAKDQAGNVSPTGSSDMAVPAPFIRYVKSVFLENGSQRFKVHHGGELQEIQLFNAGARLQVPNPNGVQCTLEIYEESDAGYVLITTADEPHRGSECGAYPVFTFASTPYLEPDRIYRWVFSLNAGTLGMVQFYGKDTDTAGGNFSNGSLVNASFVVRGTEGVLLDNE